MDFSVFIVGNGGVDSRRGRDRDDLAVEIRRTADREFMSESAESREAHAVTAEARRHPESVKSGELHAESTEVVSVAESVAEVVESAESEVIVVVRVSVERNCRGDCGEEEKSDEFFHGCSPV